MEYLRKKCQFEKKKKLVAAASAAVVMMMMIIISFRRRNALFIAKIKNSGAITMSVYACIKTKN